MKFIKLAYLNLIRGILSNLDILEARILRKYFLIAKNLKLD